MVDSQHITLNAMSGYQSYYRSRNGRGVVTFLP